MRPRFRLASAIAAILAAMLLAAPAAAANPTFVFKETGTSAFAFNGECVDDPDGTTTCESQSIDVFKGTTKQTGEPTFKGQRVCYSESSDTFNTNIGQPIESHALFGCTLLGRTVSLNNLTSITLAPTVIELTRFDCVGVDCAESDGGITTVAGTWTAFGPITRQSGKFKFDDGTCFQVNADKSRSRQASFVGTIAAVDARIAMGSFSFRTNCPF
jgi:uncharacterized membrane protein